MSSTPFTLIIGAVEPDQSADQAPLRMIFRVIDRHGLQVLKNHLQHIKLSLLSIEVASAHLLAQVPAPVLGLLLSHAA